MWPKSIKPRQPIASRVVPVSPGGGDCSLADEILSQIRSLPSLRPVQLLPRAHELGVSPMRRLMPTTSPHSCVMSLFNDLSHLIYRRMELCDHACIWPSIVSVLAACAVRVGRVMREPSL